MKARKQSRTAAKVKNDPRKKTAKKPQRNLIDPSMPMMEIISLHPFAADVLAGYGLACANCALGGFESLEEGWSIHGLPEEELKNLLQDLNDLLSGKAPTMQPAIHDRLTLTGSAAMALQNVAKESRKPICMLRVMADGHGGYCLEFTEEKKPTDVQASHPSVPSVSLVADPKLLKGIGGATVDYREGRFKLDIGKESHLSPQPGHRVPAKRNEGKRTKQK